MMMTNKTTGKENSYLPVAWEYREIIEEQLKKKRSGNKRNRRRND